MVLMITRRTLLKQGAFTTLSIATLGVLGRWAHAQEASATEFDFYISPTGSDSNPGTSESPWAITAINTHRDVYAGKRVGLLDGTYNVHALCQSASTTGSDVALAVNGGSSAASPTVIAAVNPRQAKLTAADPVSGAYPTTQAAIIGQGYLQVPNKGNVILDGLYVTRSFGGGILFFPLVETPNPEGGATGIVVRNCEVFDIGGIVSNNVGGIKFKYCTGALVSNNKIHSVQPNPGAANWANAAGIFSFLCHSNIYEYNTIYDCNAGIHDKNNHNGNHTYRYNYIEIAGLYPNSALNDCSGGQPGDVATVHNNILVAPGVWNGSDMTMPSQQSLVFYNNTVYSTNAQDGGILYMAGGSTVSPAATVSFYNNVVYVPGTAGWAGAVRFCAGTVSFSDRNLYSIAANADIFGLAPVSAPKATPTLYTLPAWQKATGHDENSVLSDLSVNALFNKPTSLDPESYALQSAAAGQTLGRVGGTASGAVTEVGAWGGGATQIGCNFGPMPRAPVLSIS
jgi:hypothetical protein